MIEYKTCLKFKGDDTMVICPVCNKENNDEEYCTDCGTKLVDINENPNFVFDENKNIHKVDELNTYLNNLNEKINQQKKFLEELNNNPLIKEYGSISKINDENNKLRTKIEELEKNKEEISSDLRKQRNLNHQLQGEIAQLKKGDDVVGIIRGIFRGTEKHRSDSNYCPNCGYKLS